MTEPFVIKVMEPGLVGPWLDFFENRAFKDNPGWRDCYCCFYHRATVDGRTVYDGDMNAKPGETLVHETSGTPAADNALVSPARVPKRERAAAMLRGGFMRGYLAYAGDRVVGWCNVNKKSAFAALQSTQDEVAVVACFVVDKDFRRRGVSRALLSTAIADAKNSGYKAVEAHPKFRASTEGGHFHGHPDLFASLGFQKVKTGKGSTIVRLTF